MVLLNQDYYFLNLYRYSSAVVDLNLYQTVKWMDKYKLTLLLRQKN
jgi:hypothetical protein